MHERLSEPPEITFGVAVNNDLPTSITFSREAAAFTDAEEWRDFFHEHNYTVQELDVSYYPDSFRIKRQVEIQPPMSSEHILELARVAKQAIGNDLNVWQADKYSPRTRNSKD